MQIRKMLVRLVKTLLSKVMPLHQGVTCGAAHSLLADIDKHDDVTESAKHGMHGVGIGNRIFVMAAGDGMGGTPNDKAPIDRPACRARTQPRQNRGLAARIGFLKGRPQGEGRIHHTKG